MSDAINPIGIFARTFRGESLAAVLEGAHRHGIRHVHFNLACANTESMPDEIEHELCRRIREGFARHPLVMIGVSGTFNAVHPDFAERRDGIRRARVLIERCAELGTDMVSLCTGSRDAENPWRAHPDNDTPEAWSDLVRTLEQLVPDAERHGVTLGIEPERANVINSASKARRLLDEMQSDRLRIIMDGANLFLPTEDLSNMREVLHEAFDLLGPDIVSVHAKDITGDTEKKRQAAGTGRLDWTTYLGLVERIGYRGPIVLHNLTEDEIDASAAFVREKLAGVRSKEAHL